MELRFFNTLKIRLWFSQADIGRDTKLNRIIIIQEDDETRRISEDCKLQPQL